MIDRKSSIQDHRSIKHVETKHELLKEKEKHGTKLYYRKPTNQTCN